MQIFGKILHSRCAGLKSSSQINLNDFQTAIAALQVAKFNEVNFSIQKFSFIHIVDYLKTFSIRVNLIPFTPCEKFQGALSHME